MWKLFHKIFSINQRPVPVNIIVCTSLIKLSLFYQHNLDYEQDQLFIICHFDFVVLNGEGIRILFSSESIFIRYIKETFFTFKLSNIIYL